MIRKLNKKYILLFAILLPLWLFPDSYLNYSWKILDEYFVFTLNKEVELKENKDNLSTTVLKIQPRTQVKIIQYDDTKKWCKAFVFDENIQKNIEGWIEYRYIIDKTKFKNGNCGINKIIKKYEDSVFINIIKMNGHFCTIFVGMQNGEMKYVIHSGKVMLKDNVIWLKYDGFSLNEPMIFYVDNSEVYDYRTGEKVYSD